MKTISAAASSAALALLVAVGVPSSAEAATFTTTSKWKNCDTTRAGLAIRTTFRDPVRYYGSGQYMVKRRIVWERLIGTGRWAESDRYASQSSWMKITNPDYDYVTTVGDTTTWGSTYYRYWRAKVTVQLIKNRPGPYDKKVEELVIWPTKGSFRELGSYCGVPF